MDEKRLSDAELVFALRTIGDRPIETAEGICAEAADALERLTTSGGNVEARAREIPSPLTPRGIADRQIWTFAYDVAFRFRADFSHAGREFFKRAKTIGVLIELLVGTDAARDGLESAYGWKQDHPDDHAADPKAMEEISQPNVPGGFIGDIWFGHSQKRNLGTHVWDGERWNVLPDEIDSLLVLLAKARARIDELEALSQSPPHACCEGMREKAAKVVVGWRECDWPEGFDRRTAELMAQDRAEKIRALPLPVSADGRDAWQPIETAPWGEEIIVGREGHAWVVTLTEPETWKGHLRPWMTHWQPLPKPPLTPPQHPKEARENETAVQRTHSRVASLEALVRRCDTKAATDFQE